MCGAPSSDSELLLQACVLFHRVDTVIWSLTRRVDIVEDADHTIEADKKRAETLGLIRVEVRRVARTGQDVMIRFDDDEEDLDAEDGDTKDHETSDMLIAEKALKGKALSHGTS